MTLSNMIIDTPGPLCYLKRTIWVWNFKKISFQYSTQHLRFWKILTRKKASQKNQIMRSILFLFFRIAFSRHGWFFQNTNRRQIYLKSFLNELPFEFPIATYFSYQSIVYRAYLRFPSQRKSPFVHSKPLIKQDAILLIKLRTMIKSRNKTHTINFFVTSSGCLMNEKTSHIF